MVLVPSRDHSKPPPPSLSRLGFHGQKSKNQTPTEPLAKNKLGCSQICRLEPSQYPPKVSSICTPSQHFRRSSSSPWPELPTSTVASCGAPTLPDHQLPSGSSGIQELRGVQGAVDETLRNPSDACSSRTWLCKQRWALPKPGSCLWLQRCLEL
jgi:hypothetical protein